MTARSRIVRLAIAGALGAAVAASGAGTPAARAQESSLGGFQGRAMSSGVHVFYTPEGLLPTGPPIDFGAPDALATISSGPSTFARAAAADPGDLLANPDAIFTLASSDYPQGTIPAWPYRVTATSGFGEPKAESTPAPGLGAQVEAHPDGSVARATMPRGDAPAVATFGSVSAEATTKTDGSAVTVTVHTEVSDLRVLDLLVVDSVVTDLFATGDGAETEVDGGTIVTGASFMGQPVTIDAEGIHAEPGEGGGGGGSPLGGLGDALGAVGDLNELLGQAGLRVTVAGPVEQEAATAGQLASSGLRIDLEISDRTFPLLSQLAAAAGQIPPPPEVPGAPTLADVLVAAQARHLTKIEVARGAVSLSATPAAEPLDFPLPTPPPSGAIGSAPSAGAPVAAPAALAPLPAAPTAPASPVRQSAATRVPDVPLGAGVGALAALVLLVQPFVGARIARMTGALLAADAVSCPWEDR